MNRWSNNDAYFAMQNQMGSIPQMMTPSPAIPTGNNSNHGNALLPPPPYLLPELNMPVNPAPLVGPLIGPVLPDNISSVDMTIGSDNEEEKSKQPQGGNEKDNTNSGNRNNNRRDNNRDRNRDDRSRRDARSNRERADADRHRSSREPYERRPDRGDRNDRGNRNERPRDRDRRERRSKWSNDDNEPHRPGGVVMPGMTAPMPGQMMPSFGNMNEMGMGPASMDMGNMQNMTNMPNMQTMGNMPNMGNMGNMQNMGNMPNMPNMQNIANMNMMPGMNMMSGMNMMNPNMMNQNMMQQPMLMPNQPICVTDAVLLPPLLGTDMPARREKPPGCRTIFVGGLPDGIVRETIAEIFQNFGPISDVKLHRQGVCHVRFERMESVDQSFSISGYRFKTNDQMENEATTLFVDYALNRDDQNEFERSSRMCAKTPLRVEPFTPAALNTIAEKIKSEDKFEEAAPTFVAWLERGECNKKNANTFYSLIQASNNQMRRLYNDKMALDEEYQNMKMALREKFASVVVQFEQVAKILSAAKHQRVSDHFTKQQRRNIEMWLKMTEELENVKEEFNTIFDEDEIERVGKNVVPSEKYEQLKMDYDNLMYELEGYKNEAYLAKDEAERKFEKFKAHFIAQQALQNKQQVFPPLPPPPMPNMATVPPMNSKPQPPPPTPDDDKVITSGPAVPPSEAKLISILTAFLMVHPLGASLDYLVSYVRSMTPNVTQATVHQVLQKYTDVFTRQTSGIGANIEHRWSFITFDAIKSEGK